MFVPLWLFFLFTGTLMAVVTLLWAMRTRQFEDQDRARFLPLVGLTPEELSSPPRAKGRLARVGVLCVLLSGGLVLATTLAVVLRSL